MMAMTETTAVMEIDHGVRYKPDASTKDDRPFPDNTTHIAYWKGIHLEIIDLGLTAWLTGPRALFRGHTEFSCGSDGGSRNLIPML